MAHLELAFLDQRPDRLRQVEQAQQVRHGRARAADGFGDLLVGQVEFRDQPAEGERFFQRIQVLALDVLDERHRDRGFVAHVADDGRHVGEARDLRGAPAALAGDDLVALRFAGRRRAERAHDDRLHDALGLDGVGEFGEGFLAHVLARLVLALLQQVHRHVGQLLARRRDGGTGRGAAWPSSASSPRPRPRFLSVIVLIPVPLRPPSLPLIRCRVVVS